MLRQNLNSKINSLKNCISDDNSSVQVSINNVVYKVSNDMSADTSLNTFIRDKVKLKGTKAMCHEGGCGVCIVTAEINGNIMAVNSCLVPIFLCDGWKITTIEGIGNRKMGYHTLQAALAGMNGSQCGFCSPGWVMNMYSLTQNGNVTMKEVENSFAGNICRCTGYRSILDSFKSVANDAPPMMRNQIKDIEDLHNVKKCTSYLKRTSDGTCRNLETVYNSSAPRLLELQLRDSTKFYKVLDIDSIFKIFIQNPDAYYVMNGGNTAHGVYRLKKKEIYIDINNVPDLHRIEKDKNSLTLGANVTLSMAKATFEKYMSEPGFEYLKNMADHIDLIASVPIRNIGTIAGNLMIKNQYHEFPSDIFLILETVGAKVLILDSPGSESSLTLLEFLDVEMHHKLIYSIVLPAMSKEYRNKSYKIMPRAQNAHALVNAGFLFKLDDDGKVLIKPNIIFGGIRPDFIHASKTEVFLKGKSIFDNKVLKDALNILNSELNPDYILPDYKPEFRKLLATCLLYKFILSINPNKVKPKLRSGAHLQQRELSSGKQDFDTDRNTWPINQPMSKIGSIHQTSGEGEYIGDIPARDDEVFCALTLADAPGTIQEIDYKEALDIDGVIAFYSAKDIPGKNAFISSADQFFCLLRDDEILFADKEIMYADQIYGMIVATSENIAKYAASKVKIIYTDGSKRKPIVTVHDALTHNDQSRIKETATWPAQKPAGENVKHKIKGNFECGLQYHFSMETQTCICHPLEDGMDVFSATQWMDLVQRNVAVVLGVPANSINLKVRRLGGGYGAKISRATQIACACALACHKLNLPARLVMSFEDNMRAIGKRVPAYLEYEVDVDENGKIQQLNGTYYGNTGSTYNESQAWIAMKFLGNCYDRSTWSMVGNDVKTDIPSNTWCRSPGSTEGVAMIENIMERIARVTEKDPLDVRMINMNETNKLVLEPMITDIKKSSDYEERKRNIKKFNEENRWKKRGISLVPMKYDMTLFGQYHSLVSIYARDGTVSVSHAGIEMGQGIHTKMAQIAAYTLGIDLKMVSVKPSTNLTTPNSWVTGGSIGSDTCGYATEQACKELLRRLQPIKEMLGGNPSWQELVFTAHTKNIDLCASFMFNTEQDVKSYSIYGVTISEVEIDVLTGQHLINRVDILADTGISLNPEIDVGQVEGAFVMGMGYWTCEDLMYDPETGSLTNYRTWNYKVPAAKDIPVDFRISFRRNAPNPLGVLRSKTAGEPPLCMSCSVPIAIRQALNAARADAGNTDPWYQLDKAVTVEKILLNSLTRIEDMVL